MNEGRGSLPTAEANAALSPAERAERKREFEELLDPLLGTLYGAALRLTRNPQDAEDLVQDTVIKTFRFFDRFERGTNFKAWILRALTNLYINQYHKAERQGERVAFEEGEEFTIYRELWQRAGRTLPVDPCEQVLAKLGEEEVRRAIDGLVTEFRVVVTLADVEDFSYEQIAQTLEIPVGTVKSRLYRGRRQLQKALWQYVREEIRT